MSLRQVSAASGNPRDFAHHEHPISKTSGPKMPSHSYQAHDHRK